MLDGTTTPSPFRIEATKLTDSYGRFEIEPLEEGYGVTLGHALRRILLSSLPGAAITQVKIDGIRHEFSDIPSVREDVTEFVLNLKKVRLKSFTDEPVAIQLEAHGACEVTAKNLTVTADVEVVNPDLYLATLDGPDAVLHAEMIVERGKRYLPQDQNEAPELGTIPIDAVFSPIRRVNYVIERKRVGPITNFERLVMEIWTDGTMEPSDALTRSAQILHEHFLQVAEFGKGVVGIGSNTAGASALPEHIVEMPIEKLELTPRAYNSLKRANISKVGEVLEMTEEELLAVRNFGKKSLDELKERLQANNLMAEASASPLLQSSGSSGLLGDQDDEEEDL